MHKDMTSLREEYENIPVPKELDFVIEQAIKRGKNSKRTRLLRPLIAVAAAILLFVASVNLSPAFASYISNLTGFETIIDFIRFDQGLSQGIDNGAGQVINQSVTDQGITLTVESAVFDGRKLMIAHELTSPDKPGHLSHYKLDFTDIDGNILPISAISTTYLGSKGLLEIWHYGNQQLPKQIILDLTSVKHLYGNDREIIDGQWTLALDLDTELVVPPTTVTIDKEITIEGIPVTIESIHIYPTVIDLELSSAVNPMHFFINSRLVDEAGNELIATGGRADTENNRYTMQFTSNYFFETNELALVFDGVYTQEDIYLEIDIENEQIYNDSNLDIEFLRKETISRPSGEEIYIWFSFDRTFDSSIISFEQWGYDQAGNQICMEQGPAQNVSYLGDEYALVFAPEQLPKTFRIKVSIRTEGAYKPVHIPLN
ncbi:MAG: DUF4179 domain-containing protein [Firmicutes bacterium]|nr:DUF4179 domain-containing protein [Bacillota bacterium]